MSKLAAFAGGVGEGYFAAKRYKDNKKRMEQQDDLLREVLTGNSMEDPGYDMDDETADATGLPRQKPKRMANGGMVMPHHTDKMSWQRQSFKKSGK